MKKAALLLSALLGATAIQAGVVVHDFNAPFDSVFRPDCDQDGTPEDVIQLVGELKVLVTVTQSAGGVKVVNVHNKPVNGTVGTSLITGETFKPVGSTGWTDTFREEVTSGTHTFVNNFHMIGDDGSSYRIHQTFHLTLINGEPVIVKDHFDIDCN